MLRPRLPEIFLSSTVISSGLTQLTLGDKEKLSYKQQRQKRQVLESFTRSCVGLKFFSTLVQLLCMGFTVCHSTSILQPNNIQNGSTCARRTSRGTWSLLPVFGVIMTETISSKLSSPDLPSAASVVCDPKFFNTGERTLLGLRATVDEKELVSITVLKMLTFTCGCSTTYRCFSIPNKVFVTFWDTMPVLTAGTRV